MVTNTTERCETCGEQIRESCYVSIGPCVTIFCFECAGYNSLPRIRPDRIICSREGHHA